MTGIKSNDEIFSEFIIENINKKRKKHVIPFKHFLLRLLKKNKIPISLKDCFESYSLQFLLNNESPYTALDLSRDLSKLVDQEYIMIHHCELSEIKSHQRYWIGLYRWFDVDCEKGYILKMKYFNKVTEKIMNETNLEWKQKYEELEYRFNNQ